MIFKNLDGNSKKTFRVGGPNAVAVVGRFFFQKRTTSFSTTNPAYQTYDSMSFNIPAGEGGIYRLRWFAEVWVNKKIQRLAFFLDGVEQHSLQVGERATNTPNHFTWEDFQSLAAGNHTISIRARQEPGGGPGAVSILSGHTHVRREG